MAKPKELPLDPSPPVAEAVVEGAKNFAAGAALVDPPKENPDAEFVEPRPNGVEVGADAELVAVPKFANPLPRVPV